MQSTNDEVRDNADGALHVLDRQQSRRKSDKSGLYIQLPVQESDLDSIMFIWAY